MSSSMQVRGGPSLKLFVHPTTVKSLLASIRKYDRGATLYVHGLRQRNGYSEARHVLGFMADLPRPSWIHPGFGIGFRPQTQEIHTT